MGDHPKGALKVLYTRLKWLVLLAFCGILIVCGGCEEKNLPHFDPQFSANLIIPGPNFPQKKIKRQITPIQQKVLDEYGAPDFIRVWWDRLGKPKRLMEVHRQIDSGEYLTKPMTWLYLEEDIEILFIDKDTYRSAKIEPKIKTIMTLGDPENVFVSTNNDIYRESWQYYSHGLTIKFNREGQIVDKAEYRGSGSWNKP